MPRLTEDNLTLSRVQRAKVKKNKDGNPVVSYLWDAEVPGFGVRINTTGNKTFVMKYRSDEGKQAWLVLGDFTGAESIAEAKEKAKGYRKNIKEGIDPRVAIKKVRDIPTFAKYCVSFLADQKLRVSASHLANTTYFLEKIAIPTIGHIRLDLVEKSDISEMVKAYTNGVRPWHKEGDAPERSTLVNGNRFRSVLVRFFNVAEEEGKRTPGSNPAKVGKKDKFKETKGRKRYLTVEEISWLGKVLRDAPKWNDKTVCPYTDEEQIVPTPYAIAAMRLLILTGARKSEILKLKWSQVDKKRMVLMVEEHKTDEDEGVKELPITPAVLEIIEVLEKLPTRRLGGEWVIQGHKLDAPMVNLSKPWARVQRAVRLASKGKVNIDDVNLHILRHTFASFGVSDGVAIAMVGSLLGHKNPSTTQRYAHLLTDPRQQASTKISEAIKDALG